MSNIIGKALLTQIESCESTGDLDGMIGYLIVALERTKELQRRINEEDLPTNETFNGNFGE